MKQYYIFILLPLLIHSCVDEHYFGKSAEKMILEFTLEGQVGNTMISQDSLRISITVGSETDITAIKPSSILLSTFATIDPDEDQLMDYSSENVTYTVTAEDGSSVDYLVILTRQGAHPQLENSDFNQWHMVAAGYAQPGADENTVWATGNAGVVTMKEANTTPLELGDFNYAAHMETLDMGNLAGLVGQRVGAATMFTGVFDLDLSNPINSAQMGISFSAKPAGFSIDYAYIPGQTYLDGKGNVLDQEDACDIYLLLENRSGEEVRRIATGWFRSGETISESFERIEVDLIYGELPAGYPDYQKPANGLYGDKEDEVSHLTFVATSSYAGNLMEGAIGSILVIDNLHLNYYNTDGTAFCHPPASLAERSFTTSE